MYVKSEQTLFMFQLVVLEWKRNAINNIKLVGEFLIWWYKISLSLSKNFQRGNNCKLIFVYLKFKFHSSFLKTMSSFPNIWLGDLIIYTFCLIWFQGIYFSKMFISVILYPQVRKSITYLTLVINQIQKFAKVTFLWIFHLYIFLFFFFILQKNSACYSSIKL